MQVVFKGTSDQIFHREVINSLGVAFVITCHGFIHLVHRKFPDCQRNGVKRLLLVNFAGSFADEIFDVMFDRKF